MLNISDKNPVKFDGSRYRTVMELGNRPHYKILRKIILGICTVLVLVLLLKESIYFGQIMTLNVKYSIYKN